jgi:hypothetical protein
LEEVTRVSTFNFKNAELKKFLAKVDVKELEHELDLVHKLRIKYLTGSKIITNLANNTLYIEGSTHVKFNILYMSAANALIHLSKEDYDKQRHMHQRLFNHFK